MQVNTELERIGFKQYPSELVVCIAVELLVASEWDRQILYTTFLIFNLCKISITDICYRKPTFISLRRKLTNKLIVLKTQSAFDFNDLLGIYVLGAARLYCGLLCSSWDFGLAFSITYLVGFSPEKSVQNETIQNLLKIHRNNRTPDSYNWYLLFQQHVRNHTGSPIHHPFNQFYLRQRLIYLT